MNHRSYRGRVDYIHDDIGERGREWFSVTVQPDGMRTLRSQCEMDDTRILRDVIYTVDGQWRPIDSYVRITVVRKRWSAKDTPPTKAAFRSGFRLTNGLDHSDHIRSFAIFGT